MATNNSKKDKTYTKAELLELRDKHIAPSLSVSYRASNPLYIVKGCDQYLFDEMGIKYLDCRNNVSHIGHSHPAITNVVNKELKILNTNTRYLHHNILLYAQKLTSKFSKNLNYCIFVNSGSEAGEVALRLAKSFTKKTDVISVEHGYHGNTNALIDISTYKLVDQPSTPLKIPETTHILSIPDMYRGNHLNEPNGNKMSENAVCEYYLNELERLIVNNKRKDKIGTFFLESIIGCGGQVFLPKNFLKKASNLLKKYGILTIIDECQTGFGRLGYPYYWGYQENSGFDYEPDIVVMGKSIGNGFPLGAIVTTKEVINGFKKNLNGMEYFNTFGGNPVSCAVGLTVLDIIDKEKLDINARDVGNYMIKLFNELKIYINNIPNNNKLYIGDIRGVGFFLGIELATDLKTKNPATKGTEYITGNMVKPPYYCLLSTDGPWESVIKIKPPMCFNKNNAKFLVDGMKDVILKYIKLKHKL